jgi:hypothetical protein
MLLMIAPLFVAEVSPSAGGRRTRQFAVSNRAAFWSEQLQATGGADGIERGGGLVIGNARTDNAGGLNLMDDTN